MNEMFNVISNVDEIKTKVTEMAKVLEDLQCNHCQELLTAESVCKLLSISKGTVNNWVQRGKLIPYKFEGKVYFKRSEIMDAVENCKMSAQ